MASLGDLVVNLTMDHRRYTSGGRTAQQTTDRLANTIRQKLVTAQERQEIAQKQINKLYAQGRLTLEEYRRASEMVSQSTAMMSQHSSKAGTIMSQLAFAVEDASVSFGTSGVSGAIRGAANNLTMIASVAGGAHGAMAAVGVVAATQLAPSLLKATGLIQDQNVELERYKKNLTSVADIIRHRLELENIGIEGRQAVRDAGRADSSQQAGSSAESARDARELLQADLRALEKEQQEIQNRLSRSTAQAAEDLKGFWEGGANLFSGGGRERRLMEEQKAASERLAEIERERVQLSDRLAQNQKLIETSTRRQSELVQSEFAALAGQGSSGAGDALVNVGEKQLKEQQKLADRQAREEDSRQREEERQAQAEQRGRTSARDLGFTLLDELDPNKRRTAERGIIRSLDSRLRDISGMEGIGESQRNALESAARESAQAELKRLEEGGTVGPVAGLQAGGKDALQTILRTGLSKDVTKESTQKQAVKKLTEIAKAVKKNPGSFTVGMLN